MLNKKFMKYGLRILLFVVILISIMLICLSFANNLMEDEINSYDGKFWNRYFSKNHIKDSYKIIVISSSEGNDGASAPGDANLAFRILRAAKSIGWEAKFFTSILGKEDEIEKFNPDFIIAISPEWNFITNRPLSYKKYSMVPLSSADFFRKKHSRNIFYSLKNWNPHIFSVSDGFIIASKKFKIFKDAVEYIFKRKFYGINGYASVHKIPYKELEYKSIAYYGANSDNTRSSSKYREFYKLLNQSKIVKFYGPMKGWVYFYNNGWCGNISGIKNVDKIHINNDPILPENDPIIDVIQENGIALVLHSDRHFFDDTPSMREFEAAASSAVIISDDHQFVKNVFGNNALYIDQNDSAEKMHEQVLNHYEWIKNNPDKAKEMTKNAHKIFYNLYSLEIMLIDIAKMHESVLVNEDVDDTSTKSNDLFKHYMKKKDIPSCPFFYQIGS